MMWSQLRNEVISGRQQDNVDDSYSNFIADIHGRIRSWLRNAHLAISQATRETLDVFAKCSKCARNHFRARSPRILNLMRSTEARFGGKTHARIGAR
jgi:hypothetical protein